MVPWAGAGKASDEPRRDATIIYRPQQHPAVRFVSDRVVVRNRKSHYREDVVVDWLLGGTAANVCISVITADLLRST